MLANHRLDSKYYLSPGTQAAERIAVCKASGVTTALLGGVDGIARSVSAPNRFKRVYATVAEQAAPYLRPYDVFDYLPLAADLLSVDRSPNLPQLQVRRGMLLQTCSGRNLGPAVAVDEFLERFAISHDMVRIAIDDERLRHYVLGFLTSPTGQALLRRDKTGSVIDHISPSHVQDLEVPILDSSTVTIVSRLIGKAIGLREQARLDIDAEVTRYSRSLPPLLGGAHHKEGWTQTAASLDGRIDAQFHEPAAKQIGIDLLASGGTRLIDVAEVLKPAGRYKTFYVGRDFGSPMLSGRQVLQAHTVNLQYLSPRSIGSPRKYILDSGWIAFQADGRAEERLGVPAMVTPDRAGWMASGHIGRLVPRSGVDAGWLYAAFATPQVQAQVKALACGSVVDALYPEDLAAVVLPAAGDLDTSKVSNAWRSFAAAQAQQDAAISRVEATITEITGEEQIPA